MSKTSCLIPCYNLEKHIVQCIESCSEFDEIIVGFDGCTDGGREKAEEWLSSQPSEVNSRYQLYSWEGNYGPQLNRNRLYDLSTGDVVCWFDGDDFRNPGLRDLVNLLLSLPLENPDSEFGSNTLFAIAGLITPYTFWAKDPLYESEVYHESSPGWVEEGPTPSIWELLTWRGIQVGGMLWKRDCLESIKSEQGWIWNPDREVLQEVNLILDALAMGYTFHVHPFLSHVYRWGWSDGQITQSRRDLYPSRLNEYYTRLKGMAPLEYVPYISEYHGKVVKEATKLALDYKNHGIEKIEPELP